MSREVKGEGSEWGVKGKVSGGVKGRGGTLYQTIKG